MSQHIDPTPKQTDLNALNSKLTLKSMTAQTDASGNIAINGYRPIIAVYSVTHIIPYIFWLNDQTVLKVEDLNLQPVVNTNVSFVYIEL